MFNSRQRQEVMRACLHILLVRAALGFLLAGISVDVVASALVPPDGYTQAVHVKRGNSGGCEEAPEPYTGKLDFPSKYEGSGSSRDELNENSEAEYKKRTASISSLEKGVVSLVTKYMKSGSPEQLSCAMSWMSIWAGANALEGQATTHTGRSIRKWTLGSLSSAYIRLKFSSTAPLKTDVDETRRIEAWLGRIADLVLKEWSPNDPITKINNHYYWVGWSLMATAVAIDRRDLFDRAIVFYRIFSKQVDQDGYLPNELNRATRAFGYHVYALAPITMIAAFAKANGVDLTRDGNNALDRLVNRVVSGIDDPDIFAKKAGARQDPKSISDKTLWLWIEPYCWSVACQPPLSDRRAAIAPQKSTRLGGDLTAIFHGSKSP